MKIKKDEENIAGLLSEMYNDSFPRNVSYHVSHVTLDTNGINSHTVNIRVWSVKGFRAPTPTQ